jgi:hypothetical protein
VPCGAEAEADLLWDRLAARAVRTLMASAAATVASVWERSCIEALGLGDRDTESPKLKLWCRRVSGSEWA